MYNIRSRMGFVFPDSYHVVVDFGESLDVEELPTEVIGESLSDVQIEIRAGVQQVDSVSVYSLV